MSSNSEKNSSDSIKVKICHKRKRRSHPVDWLVQHKNPHTGQPYLTQEHMHISEKFVDDALHVTAHFKKQKWTEYIDVSGQAYDNPADYHISVSKRLQHVHDILGVKHKILVELCVLGKNLSIVEKKYHLAKGEAKHVLRHSLECLKPLYQR